MEDRFKDGKYRRWYSSIVTRAQSRSTENCGYMERHHVLPLSLGGSNKEENLVSLTAREHYICHRLLVRMCNVPKEKKSMAWGLHLMMHNVNPYQDRYLPKSRTYELVRKEFKKIQQDVPYVRTAEHAAKIKAANIQRKGRRLSDETKAKMSAAHKGRVSPNKGKTFSAEHRAKLSAVHKERWAKKKA